MTYPHLAVMLGYIDPTGGLPPSLWGLLLGSILAAAAAAWAMLKMFGRSLWYGMFVFRRQILAGLAILLVAGITMGFFFWRRGEGGPGRAAGPAAHQSDAPRVLILALDGLDPTLLEQYMEADRLPNFSRLAAEGRFGRLETVMPPESPVAWSTFITGSDPGQHGVFDFIKRDPETYLPELSLADPNLSKLPWKGQPLWERPAIGELGMTAIRLPMTFPAPRLNGRLLSGMGTFDLHGTMGTYFYFTTRKPDDLAGRGRLLDLVRDGSTLRAAIPGPHTRGQDPASAPTVEAVVDLAQDPPILRIQGRELPVRLGRWSDWINVEYRRGALGLQKARGITRVILKQDGQDYSLYVSPLNFDPVEPLYAISHPHGYAAELYRELGAFHTRGMPFDNQAVNDGVLSDEDLISQYRTITEEGEKMLTLELGRFHSGVLFSYFEATDIMQHMFWRGIDPEHPLHHTDEAQKHKDVIPRMYETFDGILGRARTALGRQGTVVVISDHGFAPYRYSVHLNSILRELGYLQLKAGKTTTGDFFEDVDWSGTRAYALGFNAVYLNLAGREGQGIVSPAEAATLTREIAGKLEAYRVEREQTEHRPILRVHVAAELYSQATEPDMPDLVIGYARGYRASWETALGAAPAGVMEPNAKKWSGDHCIEAQEVPGVFLSSDPALDARSLRDVAPAVEAYLARQLGKTPPATQAAAVP